MPITYKNRKQVPSKYKWDISFLLDGQTPDEALKNIIKNYQKLIDMKDEKYNSEENFLKYLKLEDKLEILLNKFSNYITNWKNENVTNPGASKLQEIFIFEMNKLSQKMGPVIPGIFANQKKINEWLKKDVFKEYRVEFKRIFETKKHQLSKTIQEYITNSSRGQINSSEPFSILTTAELKFEDVIDEKGKKFKLNHSTLPRLLKNKNPIVRKRASINNKKAYLDVKQTLSNFLYQHFKHETTEAKICKFNSTIDYLVFSDRSSEKLLISLYKKVQEKTHILKKARKYHKIAYKAKYNLTMTKYDVMMPIVKTKSEMTIEMQKELVLNALKPFGEEYKNVIKKAFSEKWIDFASYPGKNTGAYSIGQTYGLKKKLILMNNTNDIRSAETLAHELGHSMHSYFSDKKQPQRMSSYKIFVAEIASIFNEMMLFDYVLKTSNNDKLKLQILHQMVRGFEGTVFRQVEWSNYEYDLYNAIEKGVPAANFETISNIYIKNSRKYTTEPNKKIKPENAVAAISVPHFYYGFYVYKYAIGQLVANIFFQRYKENGKDALKDYIDNFLSVGGSLTPLETLKKNGIDLENPETYEKGFKAYEEIVNKYSQLIKKVYKNKK